MTPCISCPNESMNGSLFCYTCWQAEHDAREYHEAGTARLLAALEDLPFDADVNDEDYASEGDYE